MGREAMQAIMGCALPCSIPQRSPKAAYGMLALI